MSDTHSNLTLISLALQPNVQKFKTNAKLKAKREPKIYFVSIVVLVKATSSLVLKEMNPLLHLN